MGIGFLLSSRHRYHNLYFLVVAVLLNGRFRDLLIEHGYLDFGSQSFLAADANAAAGGRAKVLHRVTA